MKEWTFQQYFGRTQRHERACVEMRFPLGDATFNLAPLDPLLKDYGFKLREVLADEPLPLDAAVCRLAHAMLARHKPWWHRHGKEGETGWVAIDFPFPVTTAAMLECARLVLTAEGALPPILDRQLRELSAWMENISKIKVWMLAAAQIFAREAATPAITSEVYQLGQGTKGVHFFRLGSQFDGITSELLEGNKNFTVQFLRRLGLPSTNAVLAERPEDAAEAIAQVGLPCVVKPLKMNKGSGVATGLNSEAEVAAAIAHAIEMSTAPVQVENHVTGDDFRLMVGAEQLLWAYRKTPTRITGDGKATVGELIDRENARRRAIRSGSEAYLYEIAVDEPLDRLLADRHGLTRESVLKKGRSIEVVGQGNISRGAFLEDMTGVVHPDNRALMIRVARLFRLKMTGIDFITSDISRSWKDVPCAIIEVNRTPGISGWGDGMFVYRTLFPKQLSGMIPSVAAIGSRDYLKQATRTVSAALAQRGLRVAAAGYGGAIANAGRIAQIPVARAVEQLTLDPEADAALLLCDPAEVEHVGFPPRRCDLLLLEDGNRFAWLANSADKVIEGPLAADAIENAVGRIVKRFADPSEGGPLPVLEPIEGPVNEFRLRVWRARAIPRREFWQKVGLKARDTSGLTTHVDLLGAVQGLAEHALEEANGAKLPGAFTHGELLGSWARVTFEAAVALPKQNAEPARAALLAATGRVNAIAAAP
jgi:D-alanine-D-alanine ligase-like ATP-grasp enzyme